MADAAQRSVLIVEDERGVRETISEHFEANGFAVSCCADAAGAVDRLKTHAYEGAVIDLRLPDGNGMAVLQEAVQRYPHIKPIVVTGFGGVADAVEAVKRGAIDFLIKPFPIVQLAGALGAAIDEQRSRIENTELRPPLRQGLSFDGIVGRDRAMQQLFSTVELIAPMSSTVLIQGETGTGKELVARTIHRRSSRAQHRFVAFNAAALPESLVEAELFGHAKGAFTGAVAARTGRFELAHRGTLFIDEVALMPHATQLKLLRVLQEREFERLGDSRTIKVDIRVIAATNVSLRQLVKEGKFREDLYYRLSVIPVTLPPLRSRPGDIPLLAQRIVEKSCATNGMKEKPLTQDVLRLLMAYHWPGNVRQLENVIEHAVVVGAAAPEIGVDALPDDIRKPDGDDLHPPITIPDEGLDFTSAVSQFERDLLLRGLEKAGGNKRRAARILNLSRTTFIDKLQRLDRLTGAA
jgi:two-component system response regulator PilR (NtrC family)